MSLMRIGWLISLILAAATLPAGAQVLPTIPESENRTPGQTPPQDTQQPVSNETDENSDDAPAAFHIIQTADMWNDSTTRTLTTGMVTVPSAKCMQSDFAGKLTLLDLQTSACTEISIPSLYLQRRWFAFRYVHAPPHMPCFV